MMQFTGDDVPPGIQKNCGTNHALKRESNDGTTFGSRFGLCTKLDALGKAKNVNFLSYKLRFLY